MAQNSVLRTRRSILGAALGAMAASLATALGRSEAADAASTAVMTETVTSASDTTGVSTSAGYGLKGELNAQAYPQAGAGVYGVANGSYAAFGVWGVNTEGYGVGIKGEAGDYSTGVEGTGGNGVYDHTDVAGGIGVNAGTGGDNSRALYAHTLGQGAKAVYAYADPGIGVYVDAAGMAIDAISTAGTDPGIRVHGKGDTPAIQGYNGPGPVPVAPARTGVFGVSANGTGGRFRSTNGTALAVEGTVKFKTSGLVTMAAGQRSVTVVAGADLGPKSKILALLQGNAGGTTAVQHVIANQSTNKFQIVLTAPTTAAVTIAWFLIS
jgi:hypothetical protein